MLAYVFWHWKRTDVAASDYEDRLRRFHAALAAAPSEGFHRSLSLALRDAPWANDGGDAYEEWYLMRSSADLDPLDTAAVSASRQIPHDEAAAAAAGGTGALYRLRLGQSRSVTPLFAQWFSKPAGVSYTPFLERLRPAIESSGAALWLRQLALGPATEFCLHSASPVSLPVELDARTIRLRSVWPKEA